VTFQTVVFDVDRPLTSGARQTVDVEVMVELFVALFRLKYDNSAFRICLSTSRPPFQLVLVVALQRIATQVPRVG